MTRKKTRRSRKNKSLKKLSKQMDTAETYLNRGIDYLKKGDCDNAIDNCTKAIERRPNDAEAHLLRGVAHSFKGADELAIKDFGKAIEFKPGGAQAYLWRGIAYGKKGAYDLAIEDFSSAIDKASESKPDDIAKVAYDNRGIAYGRKGNYDRAIQDYSEAIRLDRNFAEAYFDRSGAYFFKGDYDSAIEDLNKTIELKPYYTKAYNNRGIAYLAKGDLERARKDFEKASKPSDAQTYYNLGISYCSKDNYERALENFDEAIKLEPNNVPDGISPFIPHFIRFFESNTIKKENRAILFGEIYKLLNVVFHIQEDAFTKDQDVVHYSSRKILISHVRRGKSFFLNRTTKMNDPTEGELLFKLLDKEGEDYRKIDQTFQPNTYLGSFISYDETKKIYPSDDILLFWRLYGKHDKDEAAGCSLRYASTLFSEKPVTVNNLKELLEKGEFRRDSTQEHKGNTSREQEKQAPKKKYSLYRVFYWEEGGKDEAQQLNKENIKKIKKHLGDLNKLKKKDPFKSYKEKIDSFIYTVLNEIRFLFKEVHYREEKEVRIIKTDFSDNNSGKNDCFELENDFRPKSVVLGPQANKPEKWKAYIEKHDSNIKVKISKISYGNRKNLIHDSVPRS